MNNLLFCVANEAKPFINQILALRLPEYLTVMSAPLFYLVESRICPTSFEEFKTALGDNETFETDFIGASEEDCQKWVRENGLQTNFIVPNLFAIADARTAKDRTLLIQSFQEEIALDPDEEEYLAWPQFGVLPPPGKNNTWWSYRVSFKDVPEALLDLGEFGIFEADLPYYGLKDRLTDEHGVFNVTKATRILLGEDFEAVLGEDSRTH